MVIQAGNQWRVVAEKELTSEEILDYVDWLRQAKTLPSAGGVGGGASLALPGGTGVSQRGAAAAAGERGGNPSGGGGVYPTHRFDFGLAAELAGFAFETYNEPTGSARWEEGADGCRVAFKSTSLAAACYRGILTVRLRQPTVNPPCVCHPPPCL
jgi:hypothetical protein